MTLSPKAGTAPEPPQKVSDATMELIPSSPRSVGQFSTGLASRPVRIDGEVDDPHAKSCTTLLHPMNCINCCTRQVLSNKPCMCEKRSKCLCMLQPTTVHSNVLVNVLHHKVRLDTRSLLFERCSHQYGEQMRI